MPRAPRLPRAAPAALSRSPRTETRASSAARVRHGGGSSSARRFHRCCPSSPLSAIASRVTPRKRRLGPRGALRRSRAHRRSRRRCGCGHGEGCGNVPARPASRARERARDLASGAALCFVALEGATPSASPPKAPRRAPRLVPHSATRSRTRSRRAMVGDKLIASAALAQLGAAQAHHGGRRRARRAHVAAEAELVSTISGICSSLLELRKAFGASLWLLCTRCRPRSRAKIPCARGKLLAAHTRAHERARACEELAEH